MYRKAELHCEGSSMGGCLLICIHSKRAWSLSATAVYYWHVVSSVWASSPSVFMLRLCFWLFVPLSNCINDWAQNFPTSSFPSFYSIYVYNLNFFQVRLFITDCHLQWEAGCRQQSKTAKPKHIYNMYNKLQCDIVPHLHHKLQYKKSIQWIKVSNIVFKRQSARRGEFLICYSHLRKKSEKTIDQK